MKGGGKVFGVAVPNNADAVMNIAANANIANSNKATKTNDSNDFTTILERQKSILDKKRAVNEDNTTNSSSQVSKKKVHDEDENMDETLDKTNKVLEILNHINQLISLFKTETKEFTQMDLEPLKLELNELFEILSNFSLHEQMNLLKETGLGTIEELANFIMDKIGEIDIVGEKVLDPKLEELIAHLDNLFDNVKESISGDINREYTNLLDLQQIPAENQDISERNSIDQLDSEEIVLNKDHNAERHDIASEKKLDISDEPITSHLTETDEDPNNLDFTFSFQSADMNVNNEYIPQELPDFNADNQVSKEDVLQQIVDKMKLNLQENKQEVEVKLKPDILGKLLLKMELKDGIMTAKLVVDNIRTKEIIESNLIQLKEQIKDNGLDIKTFEVFVGTNQDFENQERGRFNYNPRTNKKLKIRDEFVEGTQLYDDNLMRSSTTSYHEGQLNLFA